MALSLVLQVDHGEHVLDGLLDLGVRGTGGQLGVGLLEEELELLKKQAEGEPEEPGSVTPKSQSAIRQTSVVGFPLKEVVVRVAPCKSTHTF